MREMRTILCLLSLLLVVSSAFGESDFEALLELKKGFQKDPSDQTLASWDSKALASDGCPKNWFGVVCTEGRVTSIALDNAGLAGDFGFASIATLTMLRNLSISNNQFSGTIHEIALNSMLLLKHLDISNNLFHGPIPNSLTDLKKLAVLNISMNNFEGEVPEGFEKLEELRFLDLQGNGFSGDIMHILSRLGSVVHVDLSSNEFSGSLDLGLGNSNFISSIQYLNISHNSLTGQLFAHDGIPFFDSLEVFDASDNLLEETIPSFNFVVSLRILRLGSNKLSGSLPEALLQESSMVLSELDLSNNQLEGPVGSITSMTLKKLNLSSNKLSGSLPVTVGHCAVIDMSNNMLSGNVSRFRTWGNYVEIIQLSSNSLTGIFPGQTSEFLRLTSLKASNNLLEGNLPPTLGTYPELKMIDLSHNRLGGNIPSSLLFSGKLTELNLSSNNFMGTIPGIDIHGATQNLSLASLDLSNNSLTGQIPPEMSKFQNLAFLDLSKNGFDGNIPDLPEELTGLNLSLNNLSGTVPESLRRFPESAFRPGNSLLAFPNSPSSPRDNPSLTFPKRGPGMKLGTRIGLIAGLVSAATVVAITCAAVYYKNRRRDKRNGETKKSVPSVSEKNAKASPDNSALPEKLKEAKDLEGSPMSFLPSSNPSTSRDQRLKVSSPDKLAGDLHLFDGSLAFTADELSRAPAEMVGRSCHGALYRAALDSGHVLAVKWLREGIAKGKKEFAREVKKLGNIKHPNLVSLQGYYWGPKEHEKLVISNYVDAPCLALYLHDAEAGKARPLSVHERLKIAADTSRCLNYLHNERAIPHGNLKSSNILLEGPRVNALLTDYSLHRILTPAGTAEQVLNAGALGYRPPEFASSAKTPCPSLKSDVYAFGVVLLELLTGRSSGEIVSAGAVDLTEWARMMAGEGRSGECFDRLIVDSDGAGNSVLEGLLGVALRCILPASERPDMKTVYEDVSAMVV